MQQTQSLLLLHASYLDPVSKVVHLRFGVSCAPDLGFEYFDLQRTFSIAQVCLDDFVVELLQMLNVDLNALLINDVTVSFDQG